MAGKLIPPTESADYMAEIIMQFDFIHKAQLIVSQTVVYIAFRICIN